MSGEAKGLREVFAAPPVNKEDFASWPVEGQIGYLAAAEKELRRAVALGLGQVMGLGDTVFEGDEWTPMCCRRSAVNALYDARAILLAVAKQCAEERARLEAGR